MRCVVVTISLKDVDGNGYWLYDDGQFVLALKEKPPVGAQFRTIAWLKKGVYDLRNTHWHKQQSCWYPARFPLIKTVSFGIEIVHLDMEDGKGRPWKGFVHPRVLTRRDSRWHSTGYEEQLMLLPSDLSKTRGEAELYWKKLKRAIGE
jgi:hypothetical protein